MSTAVWTNEVIASQSVAGQGNALLPAIVGAGADAYAAFISQGQIYIVKSTDGGKTWVLVGAEGVDGGSAQGTSGPALAAGQGKVYMTSPMYGPNNGPRWMYLNVLENGSWRGASAITNTNSNGQGMCVTADGRIHVLLNEVYTSGQDSQLVYM